MSQSRSLLIGVDAGTTHVKAVLLEPGVGVRHVARRSTPTRRLPGGGACHDVEPLLAAAFEVIAECAAAAAGGGGASGDRNGRGGGAASDGPAVLPRKLAPPRHAAAALATGGSVVGIGIASMAEAGVPLDASGRPLGEVMAWFDARPKVEAAAIEAAIGARELFSRTGLRAEAKYSLAKLLWWREHRGTSFRRLRHWAGVAELIAHRLTAPPPAGPRLVTNASLACRTLAFDVDRRAWDADLLRLAGLDAAQMPEVVPLGAPAGKLAGALASRLGLPAGIPIAVAGHDHLVGGLGAGLTRPGDGLDSMGSAEVALLVTDRPALDDVVRRRGFSSGLHAADGRAYVLGGLQSSGSLVEWWLDTIATDRDVAANPGADGRYEQFLASLAGAAARPGEILVRPYLRGRTAPFPDPDASLEIAGLHASHTAGDVGAAILDGAAFHLRWMFEELESVTGSRLTSIRTTGGGTKNARWLAVKAALGPWQFDVARTEEAAALGAALTAGIASGAYASLDEGLRDAAPAEPLPPVPASVAEYQAAYRDRWLPWLEQSIEREEAGAAPGV